MHHTIDEEVPLSSHSRKVGPISEDLIHPKGPQMVFQIETLSTKSEFGHVEHETSFPVGGFGEEFTKLWERLPFEKPLKKCR